MSALRLFSKGCFIVGEVGSSQGTFVVDITDTHVKVLVPSKGKVGWVVLDHFSDEELKKFRAKKAERDLKTVIAETII